MEIVAMDMKVIFSSLCFCTCVEQFQNTGNSIEET